MNAKEYNKLVELYSDALYRFILKNVKDEAEAQDVVQDAYLKLWLNREKVESEKAKSWLFSTGYHVMIDHIRKDKRLTLLEDYHENSESYTQEYHGLDDLLEKGLSRLPAIQKLVVLLRDYEGYSYEEIAEITGLNLGQVKVYIHRARTSLKDFVEKMENYYHEHQRKEL
jgi:RNA polymerase sigma-70 factor (ECF subfamily)